MRHRMAPSLPNNKKNLSSSPTSHERLILFPIWRTLFLHRSAPQCIYGRPLDGDDGRHILTDIRDKPNLIFSRVWKFKTWNTSWNPIIPTRSVMLKKILHYCSTTTIIVIVAHCEQNFRENWKIQCAHYFQINASSPAFFTTGKFKDWYIFVEITENYYL